MYSEQQLTTSGLEAEERIDWIKQNLIALVFAAPYDEKEATRTSILVEFNEYFEELLEAAATVQLADVLKTYPEDVTFNGED